MTISDFTKTAAKESAEIGTQITFLQRLLHDVLGSRGFVPRAADTQLAFMRANAVLGARDSPVLTELQAADQQQLFQRLARLFVNVDEGELSHAAAGLMSFVFPMAPDLIDQALYPRGSVRLLAENIATALAASVPYITPEDAIQRATEIAQAIDAQYMRGLDENARIQRTGGMSLGQLGEAYLAMTRAGIVNPTQPVAAQIDAMDRFLPAISRVAAARYAQGKPTAISDAVEIAKELNAQFGGAYTHKDDLVRLINTVQVIQDYRKQTGFQSGLPGALPDKEVLERYGKLLQAAQSSVSGHLVASIVLAAREGKLKPGSRAYEIAQRAMYGMLPTENDAEARALMSHSGVFKLLTDAGMDRRTAQLYLNRGVARTAMSAPVIAAAQQMQYWEFMQRVNAVYQHLLKQYKGASPEDQKILRQTAIAHVGRPFGIENEAQVKQLLQPPNPKDVQRQVEAMMAQPPRYPQPTLARAAGALAYGAGAQDLSDFITRALAGFMDYRKAVPQQLAEGQMAATPIPAAQPAEQAEPFVPKFPEPRPRAPVRPLV